MTDTPHGLSRKNSCHPVLRDYILYSITSNRLGVIEQWGLKLVILLVESPMAAM